MRPAGQTLAVGPKAVSQKWYDRTIIVCVLLVVITMCAYWPVVGNGFVNYDDRDYVTENPHIQQGLSWQGLIWAFGSVHGEHTYWHPLTWVSHMVDYELFGLKAWGHHFVNLLFHVFNTVLVFLVFRRLTGAIWRSAVLAGLFALHPLQVDTVAQVAERKNLLSGSFWLLTMFTYVNYARISTGFRVLDSKAVAPRNQQHAGLHASSSMLYILCLSFFTLGLMCKPALVTLPFVLLLLDYWPLKRLELTTQPARLKTILPLFREKLPLFVLAAASCLVTIMAHRGLGMLEADASPSLDLRIENAAVSYVRYLAKAVWPLNLAVYYPHPLSWPTWKVAVSGILLLTLSILAIRTRKERPYLSVGWFWFLGVLVPFIGLVQVGLQAMADRFAYMPLIGLFLACVWGVHGVTAHWRYQQITLLIAALFAMLGAAVLTRKQTSYWNDGISLWRHALAVTPNTDVAQHNLACALADQERYEEAVPHYEEALRLNPNRADAHGGLAYAFVREQMFAKAIQQYEEVLRLNPADAEAHNNLGSLLLKQGQVERATRHYLEAVRIKPEDPEPRSNLALALVTRGKYREAAEQLREAVRLVPSDTNAQERLAQVAAKERQLVEATAPYREALRNNPADAVARLTLGGILLDAGQVEEAVEHFAEACRVDRKNTEPHYLLGLALARSGSMEAAAREFEVTLKLDPNLAKAHCELGNLYRQSGRTSTALEHWRTAARLSPNQPELLNNLAWTLATDPKSEIRDGEEAVVFASEAVALSGTNNVGILDTLAAAYAEVGQFGEAVETGKQAHALAMAQGKTDLAEQIGQRVALYSSNRAFRQEIETK